MVGPARPAGVPISRSGCSCRPVYAVRSSAESTSSSNPRRQLSTRVGPFDRRRGGAPPALESRPPTTIASAVRLRCRRCPAARQRGARPPAAAAQKARRAQLRYSWNPRLAGNVVDRRRRPVFVMAAPAVTESRPLLLRAGAKAARQAVLSSVHGLLGAVFAVLRTTSTTLCVVVVVGGGGKAGPRASDGAPQTGPWGPHRRRRRREVRCQDKRASPTGCRRRRAGDSSASAGSVSRPAAACRCPARLASESIRHRAGGCRRRSARRCRRRDSSATELVR